MLFHDRNEAGLFLAKSLAAFHKDPNAIVVGLARGGVVLAYEIAKALSLAMHIVVPRKIGAPGNHELAIGSIMENGEGVFNAPLIQMLGVSQEYIATEVKKEMAVAKKRQALYQQETSMLSIQNRTVLLVDDGIATGFTMLGALKVMQKEGAKRIIVIAPVASTEAIDLLNDVADEVICPYILDDFLSVGNHYAIFNQTEDEEVVRLIQAAKSIHMK